MTTLAPSTKRRLQNDVRAPGRLLLTGPHVTCRKTWVSTMHAILPPRSYYYHGHGTGHDLSYYNQSLPVDGTEAWRRCVRGKGGACKTKSAFTRRTIRSCTWTPLCDEGQSCWRYGRLGRRGGNLTAWMRNRARSVPAERLVLLLSMMTLGGRRRCQLCTLAHALPLMSLCARVDVSIASDRKESQKRTMCLDIFPIYSPPIFAQHQSRPR